LTCLSHRAMSAPKDYLDKKTDLQATLTNAVKKILLDQPEDPTGMLIKLLTETRHAGSQKNDYGPYVKEGAEPIDMICMVCDDNAATMKPVKAKRRALGEYDVHFNMKYCGICHTDIHFTRNDLGMAQYPMCPGHELAGVVAAVGSKVSTFSVGDHVGVGCFVDSCLECDYCKQGEEQYCAKGTTFTYGGPDSNGRSPVGDPSYSAFTFGGYSSEMVIHERFCVKVADKSYPLEAVGPIMCAGITVYDPLIRWNISKGSTVGIAGLGGLGTMGVKLAKALGAEVTVISRSDAKKDYAMKIGADKYVAMNDEEAVKGATKTLDLIIDTISGNHPAMAYHGMLKVNGTHVLLGLAMDVGQASAVPMLFGRTAISGSLIGGISNTQKLMDLCCKYGIKPELEVIEPSYIHRVFEMLNKSNDAGLRYVIDCSKLTPDLLSSYESAPPNFE